MRALNEIQGSWLTLFHTLSQNDSRIDPNELAGPFVSVRPETYDPLLPSVLYVGKATDGEWYRTDFLLGGDLEERRKRTRNFLNEDAPKGPTEFWRFGNRLSELVAVKVGRKIEALQNLVWTNLSKIGVLNGNPRHPLRKAQRDLAIETLRLEVDFYQPDLILFVTGDYEGDVVDAVVSGSVRNRWHEEQASDGMWWREATDSMPAVLWTYHPERKAHKLRELWLQRARELFPPLIKTRKAKAGIAGS